MKFVILTDEEVKMIDMVIKTHAKVLQKQTDKGAENWTPIIEKLKELNEKIQKKVV